MRVKATGIGYDNVAVRNPGEEFDMPDGSTGSWFVPVEKNSNGSAAQPASDASNLV